MIIGNSREFWKQHRGCGIPGPAEDLITRMLWYDFNKRISIRGIKKHKWFKGLDWNQLYKKQIRPLYNGKIMIHNATEEVKYSREFMDWYLGKT